MEFRRQRRGGGPSASTDQDPGDVTFINAGDYLVRLTVTDGDGDTSTDEITITVNDPFSGYTTVEVFDDYIFDAPIAIPEFSREIVDGELIVIMNVGTGINLERAINHYPVNTSTITRFGVDVRIDQITVDPGATVVSLVGSFYNDGSSSSLEDQTGEIRAEIFTYANSSDGIISINWGILRCTDPDCDSLEDVASGDFGNLSVGMKRTFSIEFDGDSTFTFSVDGETPAMVDSGHTYGGPSVVGGGMFFGSFVANPGDTTSITVAFDNVVVNGSLYDDFSGGEIDPTKWFFDSLAPNISGGVLNLFKEGDVNLTEPTTIADADFLQFSTGYFPIAMQIDVSVDDFVKNIDAGGATTGLLTSYTNTLGEEVISGLQIYGIPNNVLNVRAVLGQCEAGTYTGCDIFVLESSSLELFTNLSSGQFYTLKMAFDGIYMTYQVDSETPISIRPASEMASGNWAAIYHAIESNFPEQVLTDEYMAIQSRVDNLMFK